MHTEKALEKSHCWLYSEAFMEGSVARNSVPCQFILPSSVYEDAECENNETTQ